LTADALSSTSILLSWKPPPMDSVNGITLNYFIKVLLVESLLSTYNTSSTSFNVTGLSKFTSYNFEVGVANEIGRGPSQSTTGKTLADCKLYLITGIERCL